MVCSWDCFAYCKFLRHAGKLMVLFVASLAALSYYAVVSDLSDRHAAAQSLSGKLLFVALLVSFNGMFILLLWSYFATVFTDPGRVPVGWHPFRDQEQALSPNEVLAMANAHPERHQWADKRNVLRPRYCRKCRAWKPPRAHHCSVSGHCVLRMDHYCIWVVNTVGLLNYKAFFCFLFWTFWATLLATVVLAGAFWHFLTEPPEEPGIGRPVALFLAFVVDCAFVLSLLGFLVIHIRLVWRNMTTIEQFEKITPEMWPFDRGWKRNFAEVFGTSPWRWFLPYSTRGEVKGLLRLTLER